MNTSDEVLSETGMKSEIERLRQALIDCGDLFAYLRGDWSDNRGPAREGMELCKIAGWSWEGYKERRQAAGDDW